MLLEQTLILGDIQDVIVCGGSAIVEFQQLLRLDRGDAETSADHDRERTEPRR